MTRLIYFAFLFLILSSCKDDDMMDPPMEEPPTVNFTDTLRFASYNLGMFGSFEGQIAEQMNNANQFTRYKRIAAVIQKVRPDVLVLMEFDYDSTGASLQKFNDNLLSVSQDGDDTLSYRYMYQIVSNTGELSQVDIDGNGTVSLPADAFGFGNFSGQYASAILSNYPLDIENARSFQKFLWKDMPDASLPQNPDGSSYYSDDALDVFRLSSKNHIDLPVILPDGKRIHALISHPTPPVFDGAEDRNGRRNHDEIKLFADYISGLDYLVDDDGQTGGMSMNTSFIVMGDLNADPLDGDSYNNAINLLLDHPSVNQEVAQGSLIPRSEGAAEHNQRSGDAGDPSYDTSFFGLRVDYVLPSADLNAIDSGVYWPASNQEGYDIVKDELASDHLLVWVDISFE